MAITFTPGPLEPRRGLDGLRRTSGTFQVDSYTAAGEPAANASYFADKTIYDIAFSDPRWSSGHTPSYDGTKLHAHKAAITAGAGEPVEDFYTDVLGGVAANHLTDQASEGVNAHTVLAATAGNDATLNGAGIVTGLTNPDLGRSLNLGLSSVGGATAVAGNIIVTGTYKGVAQAETVAVPTGAIAAGKYRNRILTKPFDTVTKVQSDTPQPADILISIGLGTKFGFAYALSTPASGDVKDVRKNTAKGTYTVDTTNGAIALTADLADGDDLSFSYVANVSAAAGLISTEAGAATNVGTVRATVVWN